MSDALLIKGARLLDPATRRDGSGDLLVQDGVIAGLGSVAAPAGTEVLDGAGMCLAPGLVDLRARICEPGEEHKESLQSAAEAAVAGGITTLACRADTDPVIEDPSLVEFIRRRSTQIGLARLRPYSSVTQGTAGKQLTEMGLLARAGCVGFHDGPKPIRDAAVLRRALAYARTFDQVVFDHPEDYALSAGSAMNEGEIATRLGLPGAPAMAERIQVERDLLLAELTGGRLHLGPLTTAASIEAVRHAKKRGIRVTADTAPHYFALNETSVGDYRTFAKVSPPLRGEMDRRAVVAGLADGTIDAIASDHTPEDQDSKRLPFAQAAFGIVGLETLLPLSLELAHGGQVPLLDLLARLTTGPAAILKQPAGRLDLGAAADLVLFDLDRPWRIEVKRFRSKSKNSPFDSRPVQGRVEATLVGGRIVHRSQP